MMQSSIFEVGMDTMLGSPDGSNDIFHLAERLVSCRRSLSVAGSDFQTKA